jgi:glutathione S-transferase
MITLCGFPASNYYGLVQHALLLKGIDFKEELNYPGHPEYRAKSPMGKVPCMVTEHGCLSETAAMIEYIEAAYPENPIMPSEPFLRAKGFELMRIAELYIELSGRRFLPEILMGVGKSESNRKLMLPVLKNAFKCLEQLGSFGPYLLGKDLTQTDIVVRYSIKTGIMAGEKIFSIDFMENTPQLKAWWDLMKDDPISQQVDLQAQQSFPSFIAYLQKAFGK